jgi:hypothetical protein
MFDTITLPIRDLEVPQFLKIRSDLLAKGIHESEELDQTRGVFIFTFGVGQVRFKLSFQKVFARKFRFLGFRFGVKPRYVVSIMAKAGREECEYRNGGYLVADSIPEAWQVWLAYVAGHQKSVHDWPTLLDLLSA